jgi:hypothetical protein
VHTDELRSFGLLEAAERIAAEVRTMTDRTLAEMHIALRAEEATRRFATGELAHRLSAHIREEVWRLASH